MEKEKITIRSYDKKDWNRLVEVYDAARKEELRWAKCERAFVSLNENSIYERLFQHKVCVACIERKIVGFSAYTKDELAWLYVDPAYARRGVGRILTQYVVEHAPKRPLHVEVLAGNVPAHKLYESFGFQPVKTACGMMPGKEEVEVVVDCMQRIF